MYILRGVLVDGDLQAWNADVLCPEPLCPRPHAWTPVWLVMTDDQYAQAAEQAQLWAEWVVIQEGLGQPRPHGLSRGTNLLVAKAVSRDLHMAVHARED